MKTKYVILFVFIILAGFITVACYADSIPVKDSLTGQIMTEKMKLGPVGQEVKEYLFGGVSIATYIGGFLFALIGMFIRWFITTKKGIKKNPETPVKFSWSFWFKDNFLRILTAMGGTLAVLFVAMRFPVEWFGVQLTMPLAFAFGFFFDWLVNYIENMKPPRTLIPEIKDTISTPN